MARSGVEDEAGCGCSYEHLLLKFDDESGLEFEEGL